MVAAKRSFYWFRTPDISSETKKLINKNRCGVAWSEINASLRQQERTGSTAEKAVALFGRLLCGIREMAANAGVTPVTMRRQVRRLAVLGLIRIEEQLPTLRLDPATGRIISRIAGRRPKRTVIVLTLNESHMRPSKPKKCDILEDRFEATGENSEDSFEPISEDSFEPTSESSKKLNTEQPPSGDADGVSTPSAAAEEPTFGWAKVAPTAARPPVDRPPTKPRYVEPDRPCRPWTDDSAERFRLTRQRLADDQSRRDAEDLLAKGGLLAQTSTIDGRRIEVGQNAVRDCD
jgi:hypothetical protein